MGKRSALLYDQLGDDATVTASAAVSTLPPSFLQKAHLSQVWRTPDSTTAADLVIDLGAAASVGLVALLNANLSAAGTFRVRGSNDNPTGTPGEVYTGPERTGFNSRYGMLAEWVDPALTARYWRIELNDASLTYLEAGRLVIGPVWYPLFGIRYPVTFGAVDASRVTTADDGSEWVDRRPARRRLSAVMPAVTEAEKEAHYESILARADPRSELFLAVDADASDIGRESYWGRLEAVPQAAFVDPDIYEVRLALTERR